MADAPLRLVPKPAEQDSAPAPGAAANPYTSMAPRFGRTAGLFARRFFSEFDFGPDDAERLRALDREGAVIYVMRYSSRLDYFLFNWLFLLSGIRLSAFANGIKFFYYRPFGEALRLLAQGVAERLRRGARGMREQSIQQIRRVVREGGTAFLFLRTDKFRTRVHFRKRAVREGRTELDYLREVIDTAFAHEVPVSLVPLALFWRKGARPQRPFLNLFYGGNERPTDTGKVLSFVWNYRNLAVRVGTPIDLRAFVDQNRASGRERVVKQVRRSLLIFLRREEKPVVGAALPSFARVQEAVLDDSEVQRAIGEISREKRRSHARVEARAQKNLIEIAASPSPTVLAVLAVLVESLFKRLFARVELHDLDPVVEAAKLHPLVLVPSHRSHFDYLILSWLFYRSHLVPPQVAAGINLSFWPLGPIFRRAGAFFLRRSFDGDPLYTAVFRSYVQHLIKDGVSQEFFIEGTRSRTGKTLRPRLGMLRMVLEAYARGARRDLYLVPVGFTYERLVEEGSVAAERGGAKKQRESLLSLFQAGRVLRYRYGSVTVRFGEPISLAQRLAHELPRRPEPGRIPDLRQASAELGVELCRRINDLVTAGRSSVAAAAILGQTANALREDELRERVIEVAALLELLGVKRAVSLERCLDSGRPEAVTELLEQAERVTRVASPRGDILQVTPELRSALDLYRATVGHALVWPGVIALALRAERSREELHRDASEWLDLLSAEYFPVEGAARRERIERVLAHLAARGWITATAADRVAPSEPGVPWLAFLRAQLQPLLEAYAAVARVVAESKGEGTRDAWIKRAQEAQREELLTGDAQFPEGVCAVAAGNALELLLRLGIVVADGNPLRGETAFHRGPEFDALEALRARLAAGRDTR
ncbi:MAG TPA: 1-acyl-sn-glycerol-3-phosphate acyltransferase [Myxococcota bacterium]|nr:1-acyl-sn-glycerol-3-phosphate acyltransferase [Myxococcota bacterium]